MAVTIELCSSYRDRGDPAAGTACPASLKLNQNLDAFEYSGSSQAPPTAIPQQCGERAAGWAG